MEGCGTVDAGLVSLPANLARQVADAGLFLELDGDCIFVVAEQALEGRGQGFTLHALVVRRGQTKPLVGETHLFGTLRLGGLLAFALYLISA